jgi:colanic acid biosynthesis glycosyl transferase WcaI
MKTLFINKVYPPSRGATGRVLQELQTNLQRLGEQVDVLYDPKSKNRLFSLLKLFFRALSISKDDYDCVVLMTDPPFLLILAPFLKKKGIKVILWSQDVYPALFSILGYKFLNTKSIRKHTINLLAFVDEVIVIGRDMKNTMIEEYKIPEDKISTIYNWSDKTVKPIRIKKDDFIVMYSGNCGKAYDFDKILAVAEKTKAEKEIKYKFICEGKQKDAILNQIKKQNLTNVIVSDYVPDEEYNKSINSASLHFVATKKETKGLMAPCKAYSALAAGIPLVYSGDKDSELSLLINEFECGISSTDSQELANYILKLYKEPKLIKKMGNNALRININFGAREAAKQFKKVIENVQ